MRSAIKVKKAAEEAAARKVLEEAKALAQALQMIGKFTIKKTVGEDKRIFGSVTGASANTSPPAQRHAHTPGSSQRAGCELREARAKPGRPRTHAHGRLCLAMLIRRPASEPSDALLTRNAPRSVSSRG